MKTRRNIRTTEVWGSTGFPMSQGVVEPDGYRVHLTGQVAWDRDFNVHCKGDACGQTRYALENIRKVLSKAGGSLDDIVSLTTYFVRTEDKQSITDVRAELLNKEFGPAATGIQVAGLWHPDLLVELTAIAVIPKDRYIS